MAEYHFQPLSPEAIAKTRDAMKRHAFDNGRYNAKAIAHELGISVSTAHRRIKRLKGNKSKVMNAPIPDSPEARRELRDAEFWRKRATVLQSSLADAEALVGELAGIRDVPVSTPEWMMSKTTGKKARSVVGLLLTDVHAGEVIDADELMGINGYNVDICRRRLRRLFAAACEVPQRWISDTDNQGVLVALGGDLVSGDIHDELRITNALTAHEQVRFVVEEITAGIRHLLDTYGAVHVVSVPGNHGRTTLKPTAKLYSRLSYDTMAATMIEDRFRGDKRVTFQITTATDAVVPIFGRTVFLTHGDKMGTGGGQGFAGPVLPIVRGTKKVEAQQAQAGRRPDLILHGHFHTSANPGAVLSNGSVPGYSEYAAGLRATIEPPKQWLFLLHQKWGLRERLDVQLEDPSTPERSRIRVPAGWSKAA
ncbi:winged helix-turn-helix domain-containing protein [Pseudochelatococcus sp. G4_1912]|uniref:winged helix-turn-helix domain-containing protein n=1 Tax=Pseudochelatococcus sp. G4_1912 TaxID=3114288 RepID=UPI0039C74BE2